jgi:hypothetical protein
MEFTWILESSVFPNGDVINSAAKKAGHFIVEWDDFWWENQKIPSITTKAIFHGSLMNADRIYHELNWKPGSFCNTNKFNCTSWYKHANQFLLNSKWINIPAKEFVENSNAIFEKLNSQENVFVRPNSPLKPFSGRVIKKDGITLKSLDFGYYFDDPMLEIIVAPVRVVKREWRYVVVNKIVVAGSGYIANGRKSNSDSPNDESWIYAQKIANSIDSPEPAYVLDICESDDGLYLLELNPFSGADLYACNGDEIVDNLAKYLKDQE